MQGKVVMIRRNGVIAELSERPQIGDFFQIYRVKDGVETILGTGYIRKSRGPNLWKINPMDKEDGSRGNTFTDVQEGDLVRSISIDS